MHPHVFQQASLTGDPVEVADQQQAQKRFRINRRAPGLAIKALQPVPHEGEVDVAIDQSEQVDLGNLDLPGGKSRTAMPRGIAAPSSWAPSSTPTYVETRRAPHEKLFFNSLTPFLHAAWSSYLASLAEFGSR